MVDIIFDACVALLVWLAQGLGITYQAINVWIFVVVWPLLFLWLIGVNLRLRRQIKELKMGVSEPEGKRAAS